MKKITGVEMADSDAIYQIDFGEMLTVVKEGEVFTTYEGEQALNSYAAKALAVKANKESIVDDDLVITGWGRHSGKKFWQLPKRLKAQIIAAGRSC